VSEQKPSFEEQLQVKKRKFDVLQTGFHRFDSSIEFVKEWVIGREIGKGDCSVVHLAQNHKNGMTRAVKILNYRTDPRYFERESTIHRQLNHPLIVGFEQYIPAAPQQRAMIVTEFVPNGTLGDYLISAANTERTVRTAGTRVAMIVIGIVLAMRYLHSCGIIHGDLKPSNILIDWDWIVRICDFSRSISSDGSDAECDHRPSLDAQYSAPERFSNEPTLESDVFSFGLILCELLTGQSVLSPRLGPIYMMRKIILDEIRPDIPDSVSPEVKHLIEDCLKYESYKRPSFETILFRLEKIGFQITHGVNSRKIHQFVTAVKLREKELGIDP
jgi:serine/threonine protein kinase